MDTIVKWLENFCPDGWVLDFITVVLTLGAMINLGAIAFFINETFGEICLIVCGFILAGMCFDNNSFFVWNIVKCFIGVNLGLICFVSLFSNITFYAIGQMGLESFTEYNYFYTSGNPFAGVVIAIGLSTLFFYTLNAYHNRKGNSLYYANLFLIIVFVANLLILIPWIESARMIIAVVASCAAPVWLVGRLILNRFKLNRNKKSQ